MAISVFVEDNVVPCLFTSAIEAYEINHKSPRGRGRNKLEAFGLLWGYALPSRGDLPDRFVVVMATIETSAVRHSDWVLPQPESIEAKRDFIRDYWPHLELIGTFHTHPYESLSEVKSIMGWRASEDGDKLFWPLFHKNFSSEMPALAHLIVTICNLERKGTAWPQRLDGGESDTGYVLSAGNRKIWIKGYATTVNNNEDGAIFEVDDDIVLDVPGLQNRFKAV
jgi:hypothetical protein